MAIRGEHMKKLVAVLEQLQGKLERFRKEGLKETPTRTIFIDPVLDALGWDVRDPDEVQLEYPTIDSKSVDYALKINLKPVLLIEAKSLNDLLADVKDVTQTTGYAANDGIMWCILSNGVRWRVYRSMEHCPAPEKLMFEVSFDPNDMEGASLEQIAQRLQRFSREEMAKGTLDALGEQTFTDSKVRKAFQQIAGDPPKVLLKMIRNAARDPLLKPQTIRESLGRVLMPLLNQQTQTTAASATKKGADRSDAALRSWKTRKARQDTGYTEETHTSGKPVEVLEVYRKLDQICLGLRTGGIGKRYLAKYIAYQDGKRTFCTVHVFRGGLRVWVKLKFHDIVDAPAFVRDVSAIGHWGVGDVELAISSTNQLALAESLIRRSFESAK
jgi:hypothetical protein